MKLKDLLEGVRVVGVVDNPNIDIRGVTDDSRKVKKGYLFVAIKGLVVDAKGFIPSVLEKGARVVVYSGTLDKKIKSKGIAFIKVKNDRKALGVIASNWYGNPSKKLKMIGVTGTDGKTTTANFIYSVLKKAGKRVGLISTISAKIDNKDIPTGFHVTNPEPVRLQEFLSMLAGKNYEYCVLEVTSHGIHQNRIAGIEFEVSLVTNVTREHLDYHKSLHDLIITKARISEVSKRIFVNRESPSYQELKKLIDPAKLSSYGFSDIEKPFKLGSNFPGKYNQLNAIGAYSVCGYFGIEDRVIRDSLEGTEGLPGRFEEISEGQNFSVVIDFAHTPAALKSVLEIAREKAEKRVIVVFGCAGQRDKGKRPLMGNIAKEYADLVVLTAEDPRTEDPSEIIDQISDDGRNVVKIPDRRKAISFAILRLARKGDMVIITGKGHERSMCIGTKEYPWSDQMVVRDELKKLNV